MASEPQPSEKFIEIQNVRISPPSLIFSDNFKKKHLGKFILQNVGKSKVFIRICDPQCTGYSVESFPRGRYISSGLRIINTVKLICEDDTPDECHIPVFINDEKIDYVVTLKPVCMAITVTPPSLEFGKINVGTIHITRTVILENSGERELIFTVDLSRCGDVVSIEPLRGRLKPRTVAMLNVKLISFVELNLESQFSIRCGHIVTKVPIKATVVQSRLEAIHQNATQHFTLLEFPPTYFGARSVVNLYIKNYSAISQMFATTGEVHQKRYNLEDLKAENMNFKFFSVYPSDGMFQEDETKLFQFTFAPIEIDALSKHIRFYFATIVMHRFRCGSLNIEGNVFDDLRSDVKSLSSFSQSGKQSGGSVGYDTPLKASQVNITTCDSDSFYSVDNPLDEDEYLHFNLETARDYIRMHLYATAEVASIEIIPESIIIKGIIIQRSEIRVLELRNRSEHLPIYLQSVKVPSVYLEKDLIYLEPLGSIQITIKIVAAKLGIIETEIIFQLMFHDVPRLEKKLKVVGRVSIPVSFEVISLPTYPKPQINLGITPNYIKEVGKQMLGVKFCTKMQKAKAITVYNCTRIDPNCNDLVAYPNDTQRSLRPWRAYEAYRTIFTRTTRYIPPTESEYELDIFDYALKKEVRNYYTNYVRTQMRKTMMVAAFEASKEYPITKEEHILCTDLQCSCCPKLKINNQKISQCFIPLTPREMDNIIVYPTIVHTRQVATNSFYKFRISIRNNNLYPIRLLVTSDKQNIVYIDGNRYIVPSKESISARMYYKSSYLGYYTSNIFLIINESTVLSIPILAEVVVRMLQLDQYLIRFNEKETHKFVKLENKLNVTVPFTWVLLNPNFTVEPSTGTIPVGQRLMCVARYHADIEGPSETEAQLLSGLTHAQKILMKVKTEARNLTALVPSVDFGYIALNVTVQKLSLLKNNEHIHLIFSVDGGDIPFGLTVFPLRGTVAPTSTYGINVRAKFTNCVQFEYIIKINVMKGDVLEIPVKGTVVYPDISIIPDKFHFPKIPASMIASMKFTVKNNSVANVYVQFDMEEYQEFSISDSKSPWVYRSITDIMLEENKSKTLYIHFYPVDASSVFFYLPIIINTILGPPLYSDTISTKVNYYLTDTVDECAVKYLKTPPNLPCVKIRTLATQQKISISMTRIKFVAVPTKRDLSYSVIIKNPQNEPEGVCMRLDDVKHPAHLEYESGIPISRTKCAIVLVLEPKEKTVLTVSFRPDVYEFGTYRAVIPVYLRSDMTMEEHTAIVIEGRYERPEIQSTHVDDDQSDIQKLLYSSDYVFMPAPAPPQCSALNFPQRMVFKNHLNDCQITPGYTKNVKLTIFEETKRMISDTDYTIIMAVGGSESVTRSFNFKFVVSISCSCGGQWARHVYGAIDDSIYTTYRFFKNYPKLRYETGYPFFVDPSDKGYPYMHECLTAAEDWLNTQVFFGLMTYEMGDNMNFANLEPASEESIKRQVQLSRLPIFHILGNLIGEQILTPLPSLSVSPEEKVALLVQIYAKIIKVLEEQGAIFTYLRPEFMFNFNDFRLFKEFVHVKKDPPYTLTDYISKYEEFTKLSKHTWLDIVLQIYKCIYLKNLMKDVEKQRANEELCEPLAAFFEVEHERKHITFITNTESLVLNWLEFHYKNNKHNLLPDLGEIEVGLFNNSLSNALVFAVVLITYCPYLTPYLKDMYDSPESVEQLFHNAVMVIKSLEMVNYSYKITPEHINQSNPLRMLMFSTYLFDVLPNMYPTETLVIKAGLSTRNSAKVELKNNNHFPIAYRAIFIPEKSQIFTTSRKVFEIPPKRRIHIVITYWARFAKTIDRTLLLSGEIGGYRYATNKCITLIGVPDLNHPTTTIKHRQELYLSETFEFLVQSPYITKATYDLQQTYETQHEPLELSSIIYHYERDRIQCARLVATNKTFDFDEKGQCIIKTVVGTLVKATIKTWLYFRNDTVGDFAVKVVSYAKDCTRNETLVVQMPKYIEQLRERPDSLFIKIPNRCRLFFDSMKNLLVKLTEGDESALWKRIVETPTGANILENLFSTTDPTTRLGTPLRCKSPEYTVVVQEDSDVILPETLMFHDECTAGYLKVPLQLKSTETHPKDFTFTMESKETLRKRFYYVSFQYTADSMNEYVDELQKINY